MPSKKLKFVPRIDGEPHRAWASVNVRREDKVRLDFLQWVWSQEFGHRLSQWDCVSILLAYYLEHEHGALGPAISEMLTTNAAPAAT